MRKLLVALLLTAAATGQEPVLVRTQVRPEGPAWIGQRTSLYVTVLMSARPERSPRFEVPELDGAFLFQAPGSPLLGTERLAGLEYTSQRFELMLFPQRDGPVEVPPVTVRVELAGETQRVETPPWTLDVRRPEGVAPGAHLITSPKLEVDERWNPAPDGAVVGDAFERTVTIRASDVMGLAIPPLPVPDVEGLAPYRAAPTVEDVLRRGALRTTRTDRVTFVCERPGSFTIPAVAYRWWNPETRRLEERELAAVWFEVQPAPSPVESSEIGPARTPVVPWVLASGVATTVALLALARRPIARAWSRWRQARALGEPACFRRLVAACKDSDPRRAWSALVAWTGRMPGERPSAAIGEIAIASTSPELLAECEALQRALLEPAEEWSGERLATLLRSARRELLRRADRGGPLPALNPG